MIDNIVLKLRNRWQVIVILVVLLLACSPTPTRGRLIVSINRASIALHSGNNHQALDEIEEALAIEPALAEFHLLASDLAYYLGEADGSEAHLVAAERTLQAEQIGFCRRARFEIDLTYMGSPDSTWERSIQECPLAYHEAVAELLEVFFSNPRRSLLPYLEQLYLAEPGETRIQQAYAHLLSVYAPEGAIELLRELAERNSEDTALETDLLRAIAEAQKEETPAYTYAQVGQVFARYQNWLLARLAFQNALVEEPDYPDAEAYLGLAKEQTGGDGYAEISSAISAQPLDTKAYVFLAIHHLNRNETTAARQALDQAARLDPENPAIAAQLGAIYAEIGDFSAATQAYLASTELASRDGQFWQLLARFSLDHDIDIRNLGLPAARNAVAVEPDSASAYELLGTIQLELEDYTQSLRSFRTSLMLDPLSARSQYLYGVLMLASGNREAADAAFMAAAALDKNGRYSDRAAESPE